jgi:anti-sigma factor RsiW
MAHLNNEDRANLVAYLDGELDENTARALEARLATDPQARAEAETLRRTWEMLDYLPRAEASTSFTNRTLERLAVQGSASRSLVQHPVRRLPWWLLATGWAAGLLLAAGGGLIAANHLWPRPPAVADDSAEVDAQIARNRRVLENRRLYEHADDLDFLRALDTPELFGDDDTAW